MRHRNKSITLRAKKAISSSTVALTASSFSQALSTTKVCATLLVEAACKRMPPAGDRGVEAAHVH